MTDIIWDWVGEAKRALVESGRERLAHLMGEMPRYTCDEKHAQLDAIYPEALALARASKNPWIEVFVRHWNLQSRILRRHQVGDWMGEAVSLIEFANRPETRDCPQSICTTQDLVNCYGNIDGPGYAEERIQATRETLERIDASWPCYQCIGGELISALNDAGRTDEALETLERIELDIRQTRRVRSPYPMVESRVHTLRLQNRLDEALAVNAEGRKHIHDDGDLRTRAQERALLLALKGEMEAAHDASPSFESIRGTHSSYVDWAEAHRLLAESASVDNDWTLDAHFRTLAEDLLTNGVLRDAFQILVWRSELACLRGRADLAKSIYAQAEAIVPRLRSPLDAPALLALLEARIAAVPDSAVELGESPDAVLDALGYDPEYDAEVLAAARARWPDDRPLLMASISVLRTLERFQAALVLFESWLDGHPNDLDAINLMAATQLDLGDLAGAGEAHERMKRCDHPEASIVSRWFAYRMAAFSGDDATAMEHVQFVVDQQPTAVNAALTLVHYLVARDALTEALVHLDRLSAAHENVGAYDWERMVVATCLGEWASVRDSAARLGWRLEGDGPIEESWELLMIRIAGPDGEEHDLFGQRTGPVTAKILSMNEVGDRAYYLDQVVFRPTPLNEAPETEDDEHTWIYPLFRVLESAGYSVFPIYGAHPGLESLDALWQELVDLGCDISVRSDDSYQIRRLDTDGEPEIRVLGLYSVLAIPSNGDLAACASTFLALTTDYPYPLVCPSLWTALGEHEEADRQRDRLEDWGF